MLLKPLLNINGNCNVNGIMREILIPMQLTLTVDGEYLCRNKKRWQAGYEHASARTLLLSKKEKIFASFFIARTKLVMVIAYDLRKSNLDVFKEIKSVSRKKHVKAGYKVNLGMCCFLRPDQTTFLKKGICD